SVDRACHAGKRGPDMHRDGGIDRAGQGRLRGGYTRLYLWDLRRRHGSLFVGPGRGRSSLVGTLDLNRANRGRIPMDRDAGMEGRYREPVHTGPASADVRSRGSIAVAVLGVRRILSARVDTLDAAAGRGNGGLWRAGTTIDPRQGESVRRGPAGRRAV